MHIKILDEAQKDIEKGFYFYEATSKGVGTYFVDSILSDIDSLKIYFGIHIKIKDYHRLLSRVFPYGIYYKFSSDTIYIYAILDSRQSPIKITDRLS